MNPRHGVVRSIGVICALAFLLQMAGCVAEWPISKVVYTTAEQQVLPFAIASGTPPIKPSEVPRYVELGYSAWHASPGTDYGTDPKNPVPYDKRTELAPAYAGAPNAARLLSFFAITDIHITDKESPAQPLYSGWSAPFAAPRLLVTCYSPVILSTTQVLDAAIQTVNALHKRSPFDFGISLGDNINNTQYNELRWFIDVLDGKAITPSSGVHDGADTIDYQRPYKAAGLDRTIPWYQVLGNHDQYLAGGAQENAKTQATHVGDTIINMANDPSPTGLNGSGFYMGVVDGATPYGDVIGAGPEEDFPTPPKVVADENRHSLVTETSTSLNWMGEFFHTDSKPVGHGFTQANLDKDFACYSFEPQSDLPLKVIVLDDTAKGPGQPDYGGGALDQARLDWLTGELQQGQDDGKLMIIAAHIPVKPAKGLTDDTPAHTFRDEKSEDSLLATLHAYPNLILWIAGHRHLNTVTAQPYDPSMAAQGPENSFWEVETASLRDFPQQFRTFDIRRNSDNTISIFVTDVDPAVTEGSPAAKSRDYAIGAARIFGATPENNADTSSQAYNAELVKQLTPAMQAVIATCGTPLE